MTVCSATSDGDESRHDFLPDLTLHQAISGPVLGVGCYSAAGSTDLCAPGPLGGRVADEASTTIGCWLRLANELFAPLNQVNVSLIVDPDSLTFGEELRAARSTARRRTGWHGPPAVRRARGDRAAPARDTAGGQRLLRCGAGRKVIAD